MRWLVIHILMGTCVSRAKFGDREGVPHHLPQPRTLVTVMGSLRGGVLAWNSLIHHLLKPNDADLALLIPQHVQVPFVLRKHAKYVWRVPEYGLNWGLALDTILQAQAVANISRTSSCLWQAPFCDWRDNARASPEIVGGTRTARNGSGAIIFYLRWVLKQRILQLRLRETYDRFVVTRSDHVYLCQHDLRSLDLRHIWVPTGEDYGGITDRHIVTSNADIILALSVIDPFVLHPDKYRHLADYNPERFIAHRWKELHLWHRVRRFKRIMFTTRTEQDRTRWSRGDTTATVLGYIRLKYPTEYRQSAAACNCDSTLSLDTRRAALCRLPYARCVTCSVHP
jgi:hypothetical protein